MQLDISDYWFFESALDYGTIVLLPKKAIIKSLKIPESIDEDEEITIHYEINGMKDYIVVKGKFNEIVKILACNKENEGLELEKELSEIYEKLQALMNGHICLINYSNTFINRLGIVSKNTGIDFRDLLHIVNRCMSLIDDVIKAKS